MIHPYQEDERMTQTLSKDIRSRFRRYIEEGWTARATGRALKISPASAELSLKVDGAVKSGRRSVGGAHFRTFR